ncbi:hypothetical protein QV000_07250 [Stenotrophomonas maltophilia]
MCNYQGYEFGAGRYPDSYCIDGMLHDADSDYLNDEDVPCPVCNRDKAIKWYADRWEGQLSAEELYANATHLVDDIRRNRGIHDQDASDIPEHGNSAGIYPAS